MLRRWRMLSTMTVEGEHRKQFRNALLSNMMSAQTRYDGMLLILAFVISLAHDRLIHPASERESMTVETRMKPSIFLLRRFESSGAL